MYFSKTLSLIFDQGRFPSKNSSLLSTIVISLTIKSVAILYSAMYACSLQQPDIALQDYVA
jgi:hypothetical protein